MGTHKNNQNEDQINQCLQLMQKVFGKDLLGMYLYGSAVTGGLKAYSDLDLFVISKRETSDEEKKLLSSELLDISGVYKKSEKRPIELLIVVESQVNPWRYPPQFDFMYGEWLRVDFSGGNYKPWESKEMGDLAVLISQLLTSYKILFGSEPKDFLVKPHEKDVLKAMKEYLGELSQNIKDDTRNVLLTAARILVYFAIKEFYSKPDAADWVIKKLPTEHQASLQKAKAVCLGESDDLWEEDIEAATKCFKFMKNKIQNS